jgi:hypothetical protein
MRKGKINKSALIQISLLLSLVFCFILSIPFSIIILLPFLNTLGPQPDKLIVFFVVLPVIIIIGIVFGYIGLFFCLLIWKPLLTKTDIDECIYKQILFRRGLVISKKDIRWLKKNILKKPWYLLMAAILSFAFILDRLYRKIVTTIFPGEQIDS